MNIKQFKILAQLPEDYDYEIFNQNNHLLILGKKNQEVIGFYLIDDKLKPICFEPNYRNNNE